MTDLSQTPPAPGSNLTAIKELMEFTREAGRLMAQGKDSLPMLAVKVARAAADGVISADKDTSGEDDYHRIYASFMASASKKAVHEHTSGGIKANASKLRQVGMAASKPTCDFVAVLDKVFQKRGEMVTAKEKVKAAYPAYVDAARTQIAQDDDLTDEQIVEAIRKPEADEQTVEKVLARVEKTLEDLISGEKGIKCDDPAITGAHEMIRTHLAALMLNAERDETLRKARALGLIPAAEEAQVEAPALAPV